MQILVIGAGAWGTAVAISAAQQHPVRLWVRDDAQRAAMQACGRNDRYLPEVSLPETLTLCGGEGTTLADAARDCDLAVVATPVAGLRATLLALGGIQAPVAWLCKGFEATTGLLPHEGQQQVAEIGRAHV